MAGEGFEIRDGKVWALDAEGSAPIALGPEDSVIDAMRVFLMQVRRTPSPSSIEPPIGRRVLIERREERYAIVISGRVIARNSSGEVTIRNLSEQGCRFEPKLGSLTPGQPISLRIGPVGPMTAQVKWCDESHVGVEFDSPLYPSVLTHIREHFDGR